MSESVKEQFKKEYANGGFPEKLLEKYECVESLSRTPLGQTFLFKNRLTGENVAVKAYPPGETSGGEYLLSGMNHEGIPKYIDSFKADDADYLVRSYINGKPLSELVKNGPLAPSRVINLGIEICDILMYIHSLTPPVIHRDVKPENIILGTDGRLTLIDFGIARTFDSSSDKDTALFGTADYASPEQYGYQQTDARSDIYSLGVTLLFLKTGQSSMPGALDALDESPLSDAIRRCCAFSPKERYSDAAQVKKALERARPEAMKKRILLISLIIALMLAISVVIGVAISRVISHKYSYSAAEYHETDQSLIGEAAAYMNKKYATDIFTSDGVAARVGYFRDIAINIYGRDKDYMYAEPTDIEALPHEDAHNFFPYFEMEDEQFLLLGEAYYYCVKLYWPKFVADWTWLEGKESTGEYPGGRTAMALCEKYGVADVNYHISRMSKGDLTLMLCRLDKLYDKLGSDISYEGLGL